MFRALPDGAVLFEVIRDGAGTPVDYLVQDVNDAFEAVWGLPGSAWIGKRLSETEISPGHVARLAAVVATGKPTRYEIHDRARDRDLEVSAFMVDGRLTTTIRDVTAKVRAEAERRATDELFRTTVENLPINLVLYDRDYHILYVNPALAAICAPMCKRSPTELLGLRGPEIWPEPIWAPLFAHTERAVETRERQTYELETTIPGRKPWVRQWTVVPLVGPDGGVDRILAMSMDITELRRAEQRRSEFIAILSHELRNPLAAIRMSLYVLEHGPLNVETVANWRKVVDRQVDQLVHMVDDLLDVTRMTHNKVQLQRRRLDINDLVRATVEDNRPNLERSGVRVEVGLASAPIHVNADSVRIAQVLTNLLTNAVKFTPAGGKATVSVGADPSGKAVLSVRDTGAGIDAHLLPKLFDPFMQADRTLDRPGGGLGLGLALVRGLVELHGGEVSATSAGAGQGAEFVVRLPLDAQDAAGPAAVPAPAPLDRARRRVLVIEDDADVVDSLKKALEIFGHEVAIARNGRDGVAQAHAMRPEVVLCDIGLPGMDGYQVARTLRADTELDGTLLVALSGYTQADDVARAREAGFDEHLAKPVTLDRINGVLGLRPGPRSRH
jgi:PAS domain S-box-containing protein